MATYHVSGGVTSTGVVLNNYDYMYVYSSGTANSTIVNYGGGMYVSSGGTANSTTVNSYGGMTVYGGGTVNSTTMSGGGVTVSSGGTANSTTVSLGCLYVSSGGTANSTTVNSLGQMFVSSGGTATAIVENGGYVGVDDGATVTFVSNTITDLVITGSATLHSGTTAENATVNSWLLVRGGTANGTTLNGGGISVSGGGTANSTTMSGGNVTVYSGGTVNSTTMSGGSVTVSSGGTANSTTVDSYGGMTVSSGGTANSTTLNAWGSMTVYYGGTANIAFNPWQGKIFSSTGAVVTYLERDANIYYGNSYVGLISKCDSVTGFEVTGGNSAIIFSGGTADNTTVDSNGQMYVESSGSADRTTVDSGGYLVISSGGTATAIVENGGWVAVDDDADVSFSSNVFSGSVLAWNGATVHSGTTAVSTTVNSGGSMAIHGGRAVGTTLNWYTKMYSGTAENTTINSGGILTVSGGTAGDTIVNSGGSMAIHSGGKVTGRLEIASGGVVLAEEGGIIDFDISGISSEAPARVNNLKLVQGTPDFAITVSETQIKGVYVLAEGAAGFNKTVTICTTASVCDTLNVFGTAILDGQAYTMDITDDLLTLTVSEIPITPALPGDLNADRRADVIMSITEPGHGAEGATGAWLIQSGQTAAWGNLSQRNPGWEIFGMGVSTAGKATCDVYVKSSDNVIGAWVTNNTGHVSGWETVGEFDDATQILGLGDFNADGQTDLLLRNVNGAVGCFFTSGDTTGWNYFQSLGDEWKIAAVGDLNGDGRDDVVLKHDAGFAGSWLTQSDGTMVWANLDTLPEGFAVIGAGDFDGDGVDDVLLQKGSYYGAWLVEAGSVKSWFGLGDLGNVSVEQIADFDGDGKDDLRIRTSAGDLGAQLVRAADTLEWRYYGSVGAEWSTSLAAI